MKSQIKTVVIEAAVVVAVGCAAALAANTLSPRGLVLTRNYFPGSTNPPAKISKPPVTTVTPSATNEPSADDEVSGRLRAKSLQEIKRSQVEALLRDPRAKDGRVILVDARDEGVYEEGHIHGAYELDPYHPEKAMSTVLDACLAAEQVVVYCTGGDCEDADTAAILLRDAGVPPDKLFVYGGGISEWEANHLPEDTGPGKGAAK